MRRFLTLGAAGTALGVTLVVTGVWPDLARSLDLLTGRSVTGQTESALVSTLCWVAAVALAVGAVWRARPHGRPGRRALALARPLLVLIIGVALLAAGVAHQNGYRVCCATPSSSQEAQRLVR